MMNTLFTLICVVLLSVSSAQEKKCSECEKMELLKVELDNAYKKLPAKKSATGPTEEDKAVENTSANIYVYVCDFAVEKSSPEDKLALSRLVIHVYNLNIENALVSDMFSCFYLKYQTNSKEFNQLAEKAKITKSLGLVIREGSRR